MIRRLLLLASTNPTLSRALPRLPFVRGSVRRFMPGEELNEALDAASGLQELKTGTVLTLLGENVESSEGARGTVAAYLEALDAIGGRGLDVELSVKPTQLGLELGGGDLRGNLEEVVAAAEARGIRVWIDMEASPTVDATLALFRDMRERHEGVGLCLQTYLRRTPRDLEQLLPLDPAIRLVKGAYAEPPAVAFPRKEEVDDAFASLGLRLLERAAEGRATAVFGTHDTRLIQVLESAAVEGGVPRERWEVHMLYGIRTGEQERLRRGGTPLRVLISYGPAWFPWYMRRLAERPANLWFVVRSVVGGG